MKQLFNVVLLIESKGSFKIYWPNSTVKFWAVIISHLLNLFEHNFQPSSAALCIYRAVNDSHWLYFLPHKLQNKWKFTFIFNRILCNQNQYACFYINVLWQMKLEFINITPNTSKYMQHSFNIVWFKTFHVNVIFHYLVVSAET